MVLSAAIEMLTRTVTLTGTARVISETNHGLQAATSLMVRDFMQTGQSIPLGGIPVPSGAGAQALFRPAPDVTMTFPASDTLPALSTGQRPRTDAARRRRPTW